MAKKIKLWCLECVPMLIVSALALLYIVPKHVGGLSGIMPMLHLIPVFIWGVMHFRSISLTALALVGVLVDVASSLPLGLSALCYVLFLLLVGSQRKYIYREGFAVMWGYFALFMAIMQLVTWSMAWFYSGIQPPFSNMPLQWLLTTLLYPSMHWLLYPLVEKIASARYRLLHA